MTQNGQLFGWGKGFLGSGLDDEARLEPFVLPFEKKVVKVACGSKHSALIDDDGLAWTWGAAGSFFSGGGQLGHGSSGSENVPKLVEAFESIGAKIADVSCGHAHTAFLTDDGEVLTCGVGEYGVLGTGSTSNATVPVPLESLDNEVITHISAGYDHTLALNADGVIFSWGRNNSGQLGHSDSFIDMYSMEDFPRPIEDMLPVTQISAGHSRSAAVTNDGQLYVWGSRLHHAPKLFGRELFDGLKVKEVKIGGTQGQSVIAVITEDNAIWTFGDGSSYMLGNAQGSSIMGKQPLPARVKSLIGRKIVGTCTGFGNHIFAFVEYDPAQN